MRAALMQYEMFISAALAKRPRPLHEKACLTDYHIHHIKPCCMFALGRNDPAAHEPSNLVYLTRKEHLEAHRLLMRAHPHNSKLRYAYQQMAKEPVRETEDWMTKPVPQAQPKPQTQSEPVKSRTPWGMWMLTAIMLAYLALIMFTQSHGPGWLGVLVTVSPVLVLVGWIGGALLLDKLKTAFNPTRNQ